MQSPACPGPPDVRRVSISTASVGFRGDIIAERGLDKVSVSHVESYPHQQLSETPDLGERSAPAYLEMRRAMAGSCR